jgi:hypothetical protein
MNSVLTILEGITLLGVVKFLLVTLLLVYAIFALLMMRQIVAMTKAVTIRDDFVIRIMGVIHFVFAILVLILSIVLL